MEICYRARNMSETDMEKNWKRNSVNVKSHTDALHIWNNVTSKFLGPPDMDSSQRLPEVENHHLL